MLDNAVNGKNILLYGDGSVRRTFTHIKDVCDNLICGAFSDKCLNDVLNIGGEDMSLQEVAKLIAKKYCVDVEYVEYPDLAMKIETGDTVFDASKLKKVGILATHRFKKWINREKITMNYLNEEYKQRLSVGISNYLIIIVPEALRKAVSV